MEEKAGEGKGGAGCYREGFMIVIVDIDGTLADISHRIKYIQSDPKDWDKFYDNMVNDSPIYDVCIAVIALAASYRIVYITGRPLSHKRQTLDWLQRYMLPTGYLFMRSIGDRRQDYIVKKELYEREVKSLLPLHGGKVHLAIEDRKQVVDMWRSLGITTLQPKDGDY